MWSVRPPASQVDCDQIEAGCHGRAQPACPQERQGAVDTTVLLLLFVFTAVNIAVLVLRRDPVDHSHFRAPTAIPVIGTGVSIALMTTKDLEIFVRAGALLLMGVALWALNWWAHVRNVVPYDGPTVGEAD